MIDKLSDVFAKMFDFQTTANLLSYDFVVQAVLAAALLGLLAGAIGPLIVSRQMSFAVHGTSELSLTGAAAALLAGIGVGAGAIAGSVVAAVMFGLLGSRARERDSVIAVVLSFGLGLSVLFLWLGPSRAGSKFSLLTGQVVSVGNGGLTMLAVCSVAVLAVLAFVYRPLLFASTDPEVAVARGVPVRALSVVFAVLLGITAAFGVQIVGALLVLSLLITPAAAAARLTASPARATLLAILFAEISAVGGILLSLAPGVPVSTFVTAISFAIYLVCRVVGMRTRRPTPAPEPASALAG
ncbi:zinc/manganese transport system permease protein [Nocardia transvalensis]|uniref:Zinc/manganese transport system permease protein n=2 Tax=Nocardia transvalensis TaxID=37333 RepID=A0A7W9UHK9_9NOCA|nr:metal ABC transporter permease [Nocardia transvalensis]MBB5913306.1 zinc/manganese transport system permease protein [Nocardia transvalensis]